MLGAGERRFVLLDFLLIVLREVRTGSSDMCGGGSHCTHGGVWGIRPNPSTSITSPHTGWRQLSEAASSALQRPPARPGHRFRSHRCGFPADTCSAPPSLLPLTIQLQLEAGTRPPTAGSRAGPWRRRGVWAGSAGFGWSRGTASAKAAMPECVRLTVVFPSAS